jgi:hypothetical protein
MDVETALYSSNPMHNNVIAERPKLHSKRQALPLKTVPKTPSVQGRQREAAVDEFNVYQPKSEGRKMQFESNPLHRPGPVKVLANATSISTAHSTTIVKRGSDVGSPVMSSSGSSPNQSHHSNSPNISLEYAKKHSSSFKMTNVGSSRRSVKSKKAESSSFG